MTNQTQTYDPATALVFALVVDNEINGTTADRADAEREAGELAVFGKVTAYHGPAHLFCDIEDYQADHACTIARAITKTGNRATIRQAFTRSERHDA